MNHHVGVMMAFTYPWSGGEGGRGVKRGEGRTRGKSTGRQTWDFGAGDVHEGLGLNGARARNRKFYISGTKMQLSVSNESKTSVTALSAYSRGRGLHMSLLRV